MIQRFGRGEYERVKGPAGQLVNHRPDESEDSFLERTSDEIVAETKKQLGTQPCYVVQPLRRNEETLETEPQPRPRITRDEWLAANGLKPIDDQVG